MVPVAAASIDVAARILPNRRPDPWKLLAGIGQELTGGGPFAPAAARVLHALDRAVGARRSAVTLVSPEGQSFEVTALHGVEKGTFRPRIGAGVVGRVTETGLPIVVPTMRHDAMALSEWPDPMEWARGGWALVAVPLTASGRTVGALSAYFVRDPDLDFASVTSVLAVTASLLSQALRNVHLETALGPTEPDDETESPGRSAFEYSNMIGGSSAMRQVYEQVGQVARTSATALVRGESGTGKELVAHAIHHNSTRARLPFVKLNCAALPETLIESELFGHERGAFTGAHARKKGRFELAEGGTLFLDEIGELSLVTQAKLLRVLQFREFERLGGTETIRADVRIVTATNRDMEAAVASGAFREDLYYRVNVFTITVPPLRDRRADIPALADYFLSKYATQHGRRVGRISSGAMETLTQHAWPGNVRELENVIERAVVVARGGVVEERDLPAALVAQPLSASLGRATLAQAVEDLERRMIDEALRDTRGNCARAARILGTTERIVRYKAGKLGLEPNRFR
jgi:Nif-specific regulatory protein